MSFSSVNGWKQFNRQIIALKMPANVDQQKPNDFKTNFMTIVGKLIRTKEPDLLGDQTHKLQVRIENLIEFPFY